MFEDSLISPRIAERDVVLRSAIICAAALQSFLAAALWISPLLHPERLSLEPLAPPVWLIPVHHPPKLHAEAVPQVRSADSTPSHGMALTQSPTRASIIPAPVTESAELPHSVANLWAADSAGLPVAVQQTGPAPPVRVGSGDGGAGARAANRVRVSSGVSSGLLLTPIRPLYPRLAMAARVEGTVIVEAVISRDGIIMRAHVTSGPAMLAGAALDAVREARYRPYELNGQPTEVETTFSIVFRLGAR